MSEFAGDQNEKLNKLRSDAWRGKWKEVYKTYKQERELRTKDITGTGDTVLHMAVSSGKTHVVKYMVYLSERDARDVEEAGWNVDAVLGAENRRKNTPLHLAAIIGNVEMCITICRSHRTPSSLIEKRNCDGQTPLFLAALCGMKEAFIWLHRRYAENNGVSSDNFAQFARDNNNDTILHCTIAEGHFDVTIEIVDLYKYQMKEMMKPNKEGLTPLHLLAAQPSAFKSWGLLDLVPSSLLPIDGRLPQIRKGKETRTWSLHIMNQLLRHAYNEDKESIISKEVSGYDVMTVETPLMIAAKAGTVEMVEKILELFPLTINDMDAERKNILLLAVEYRQAKVCMFLCKQKWLTESLFGQVDEDGNNALHLAARLGDEPDIFSLWDALFMSKELEFFQFVQNLAPRTLLERHNKKLETPNDILRKSHKELMKSEGEWVAKTSQVCFLVSTLLATMAFSHLTISSNENNYSSLLAFSLSLIATIFFLAILAFPYQSLNYWKYVPFMLHIAISSMLTSMICLWISFMLHDHSLTPYIILGSPIAILTIVLLPVFIGPTLMSMFNKVPSANRNITSAIFYRRTNNLNS